MTEQNFANQLSCTKRWLVNQLFENRIVALRSLWRFSQREQSTRRFFPRQARKTRGQIDLTSQISRGGSRFLHEWFAPT